MSSWARVGVSIPTATIRRGEDRPGTLCECGDHVFANITKGYVALVSPCDAGVFNRKWRAQVNRNHVAVARTIWPERETEFLHRLIMGSRDGKIIDHASRNSLDNRRENLRFCDSAQNSWNSRSTRNRTVDLPKGVNRKGLRFVANIMVRGKKHYLGAYLTPEGASEAYIAAAKKYHGEFARWNDGTTDMLKPMKSRLESEEELKIQKFIKKVKGWERGDDAEWIKTKLGDLRAVVRALENRDKE